MYNISEYVFHVIRGICQIEDIRVEKFTGSPQNFYVLHPIYEKPDSKLYVPTESGDTYLKQIFSKEELDSVIAESAKENIEWIDHNSRRKNYFTDILHNGTPAQTIALIRFLSNRKRELEKSGKKLIATDERILSELHKKVDRGFSFVLGIDESDVAQYVLDQFDKFGE